ncbi:SurA N-terminal domain-containing protein [Sphaerisporangium album]|uniref:SurA N-terminal domain-containing protein n=1 Tax=Sphaerisporangium album TaxID=509200 RepID=UPI0015F0E020|nr:SurA N-terminal domain-containing protein [Sphaerisporangium album]
MKSIRVRALLAVAAAVLACVALTACSSPVSLGSAATVGDQRISSSELNAEIEEYQAALKKAKISEAQLQIPSVPRAILLQLIYFRQFEQFARRNGVVVTEGDVDKFITEQGGMQQIGPAALSKGVPPSETRAWIRAAIIYQKGLERFGANLTDQASVQAAQMKLFGQMDAVPVKISPRYGTWDTQRGLVEEARFGKPAAGTDAATPQDPSQQQDPNQSDPAAGQ